MTDTGVLLLELEDLWQELDAVTRDVWLRASYFAAEPVSAELADACGIPGDARLALAGRGLIDLQSDGAFRVSALGRDFAQRCDNAAARAAARRAFLDGVLARAGAIDLATGARIYAADHAHFEQALSLLTEDPTDGPRWLFLLDRVATALHAQRELGPARDLLEMTLALSSKVVGGNDEMAIAARRSNLGLVLLDLGELQRARDLLEQALATALKNLGEDHYAVASTRYNLASIHEQQQDFARALALLEQVLHARERNLGPDHPSTAATRARISALKTR